MRQKPLVFLFILLLSGCAAAPAAITYRGHSLTGSGSPSPDMQQFSFEVSDNEVTCRGRYNLPKAFAANFTFPISCTDGRTGKVEAERSQLPIDLDPRRPDKGGVDYPVRGKITFSDGAIGMFNLGGDARNMNTSSLIYQNFIEGLNEPRLQ